MSICTAFETMAPAIDTPIWLMNLPPARRAPHITRAAAMVPAREKRAT